MEVTSIGILRSIDLHVEVDPTVCPRSMMQYDSMGDDMSMQEHTMMSDNSQVHAEMYGSIQRGIVPCREETHSGEYGDVTPLQQHIVVGDHLHHFSRCMVDERWRLVDQQSEGLLLVVLDGWDSVMTIGEHLSWILMDELLVKSLGLTKACDTSQSYSQLQMFLLSCPDTFIIDNNMKRDRSWLGAWRVSRPRIYDSSTFMAYSRSEVDHVRQTVETWCVMVSIIDQVMTYECSGLPTGISLAQE
jgi:hypothetical protein